MTETPDRVGEIFAAIDTFQRTHRLPGLQHAQIRGLLAEHLARVLPAAVVVRVPDTSQTADRDRIAQAARTVPLRLGPNAIAMAQRGEPIILNMNEADDLADAVLAVLPEQADRAAVLREAADALDATRAPFPIAVQNGITWATAELRRAAAAEPAAAGPDQTRDGHSCRNCEGVDTDTCLVNPDRPKQPPMDPVHILGIAAASAVGGAQPKEAGA